MLLLQPRDVSGSDPASADPLGLEDFVVMHRVALVRYAALLTGCVSEAEDLVHEVLARLVTRWGEIDEPLPYARRAITNEFLGRRRRWSARNIFLVDDDDVLHRVAADAADDRPDPQLWEFVMSLSRAQRCALVLRYYEGFNDAEIAQLLSCRPVTVRSHIHRGLAALRISLTRSWIHGDTEQES